MEKRRHLFSIFIFGLLFFLINFDFFGVATMAFAIKKEYYVSIFTAEWIVNSFLLGFFSLLLAIGRVGDYIGRKKLLIIGSSLFAASSIFCGFSTNLNMLLIGRFIQGAAASMIFVCCLALISHYFSSIAKKSQAIAICISLACLGSAVGIISSQTLIENTTWHWFFFVSPSVLLITYVLTTLTVEESIDETVLGKFDLVGFITVSLASFCLMIGLLLADHFGMFSKQVGYLLFFASIFYCFFYFVEKKRINPLIEFSQLNQPLFLLSAIVGFISNAGWGSFTLFLFIYTKFALELSVYSLAYLWFLYAGVLIFTSFTLQYWIKYISNKKALSIGMMITTIAFLTLCLVIFFDQYSYQLAFIIIGTLLGAVGFTFSYSLSFSFAFTSQPREKAGTTASILSGIRMLGIVIGVIISFSIYKSIEMKQFNAIIAATKDLSFIDYRTQMYALIEGIQQAMIRLSNMPADTAELIKQVYNESAQVAFFYVMLVWCLLSGFGFYVSTRLPDGSRYLK